MDRLTTKRLESIGGQIPKKVLDQMIVTKKDDSKAIVDDIIDNNKRAPEKVKKVLRDLRDNKGAFDNDVREEDPKITSKADRFLNKRIAHEMRVGRLQPAGEDKFMRKMKRAMKGNPPVRELKWQANRDQDRRSPAMRRFTH